MIILSYIHAASQGIQPTEGHCFKFVRLSYLRKVLFRFKCTVVINPSAPDAQGVKYKIFYELNLVIISKPSTRRVMVLVWK